MGFGSWSTSAYTTHVDATRRSGRATFAHDADIASGRVAAGVHALLDPLQRNNKGAHAGLITREMIVSDAHPDPTAVAVVLDVTGSNIAAAKVVHRKLPNLLDVLRGNQIADPQLLLMAIGDATSDRVPLQVGQFETDLKIIEILEAMYLEGAGGGQVHETYELAAYFLAHYTYLEPKGKKGYAFFIGDEMPYQMVEPNYRSGYGGHSLKSLMDDDRTEPVSTADVFRRLQETYEVFFLFQEQGQYPVGEILPTWQRLLGERALVLDDPAAVCETIALTIGAISGAVDLDTGAQLLLAADPNNRKAVAAATNALARVGGTIVATTTGKLPATTAASGAQRL